MKSIATIASLLFGTAFLAGCSHVDTGEIDYRVVTTSNPTPGAKAACATCVEIGDRYRISGDDVTPFKTGDIYSMELEQMVVGNNIIEGHVLGYNFDKKGEFAVLANVFEFAGDAASAPSRKFVQSNRLETAAEDTSDVELKLIHYGDDIRAFQPMNFSNLPLQQRSRYNGGSMGIQIAVLEVDTGEGPMASLLTTLARFGQKAIPVSSEVSDVLFDLGESLFTGGSGDDRLFDYKFALSRATDDADATQALFVPGRYILRRSQLRGAQAGKKMWDKVYLDSATGRLVNGSGGEIRDEMYLIVNVRRYPEGTLPEYYEQDRWATVREELVRADPVTTGITSLKSNLISAIEKQRSDEWQKILFNRWSLAEVELRSLQRRHVPNLATDLASCDTTVRNRARRSSDLAELTAKTALQEFVAQYQNATKPIPGGSSVEFSDADKDELVARVAQFFLPWEGDLQSKFADRSTFDAFVKDNAAGIASSAPATAKSRARALTSCADLPGAAPAA